MSSALQSVLSGLQQVNYLTGMPIVIRRRSLSRLIAAVTLTAVGYDYGEPYLLVQCEVLICILSVLTLPNEVLSRKSCTKFSGLMISIDKIHLGQ